MYNRRHSLVQILWFLNRILVPVQIVVHVLISFWPNPSIMLCRALGQTFGNWIGVLNIFIIQTSLALRTAAIYERSRRVSLFVATLVIGSTVSRIVILALRPIPNKPVKGFSDVLVCLDFPFRQNSASFFGPVFVDVTLYLMTVWRLYQQSPPNLGPQIRRTNTLFPLLYRDGAIYLFVVAAAMGMSVVGFFYRPLLGAFTESDLYIVACSIACSRLILHLKESSRRNSYRNRDMPSSWEPPFDLQAGLTPSRIITPSELIFGSDADPSSDSSPVISGSSEEMQEMHTRSGERGEGRTASENSAELRSFGSTPCPIQSSAEED